MHKYTRIYTNIHEYTRISRIYTNIHDHTRIYTNIHASTVPLLRPVDRLDQVSSTTLRSSESVLKSSHNDATSSAEHPNLCANRWLNGQVANSQQPLDFDVFAWAQCNLGLHCASMEEMARRQEAIAFADVL